VPVLEPPDPLLTDGVVTLRPPDDRDLDAIAQALVDRDVVRWFGQPTMTAVETLQLNRRRWLDASGPTFAICEAGAAEKPCVGHVWMNIATGGEGSIGFWLLPDVRGRGLATRSVQLMANWAIGAIALERVRILVEPTNEASQRVAENSGFRRQGVLRENAQLEDRSIDHVQYVMPMDTPEGGGS
jgi:RimJ/RimL family protein N-acetyltransferase